MMDCAGSMLFWLGKDKEGRSAVVQTDGAVAINIGGQSGKEFNEGRLDIRVNVNKKGTAEERLKGLDRTNGDYVISVSKSGLVIAGMNNAPMVIRNSGDLCLESTSDIKLIAGGSIIKKEEFSEQKNIGENQDASTTKVSGFCKVDELINSEKFFSEDEKNSFLEGLKVDRKKGYCFTQGQVDKGLIGFAVSISNKKLGIEASLSSIFNSNDFLLEHEPVIYANLTSYGLLVEKYINEIFNDIQNYHHKPN